MTTIINITYLIIYKCYDIHKFKKEIKDVNLMSDDTGDIIKYLRKKHNFTQRDVGKYLNLSQSQLAKVESNERNLKVDNIRKLCILYNVPEEYILYGEGKFDENKIAFKKDNKAIELKTLARMNKIINNLKTMSKLYKECEENDKS